MRIIPEHDVEENIVDAVEEDIDVKLHEVIIIDPIFFTDEYSIETSFQINNIVYEARIIFHITSNNSQWSGNIYRCHGHQISSWYQKISSPLLIHSQLP